MINIIITIWLLANPSDAEVESFRATDPFDLTTEIAREHLVAAHTAARLYDVDTSIAALPTN